MARPHALFRRDAVQRFQAKHDDLTLVLTVLGPGDRGKRGVLMEKRDEENRLVEKVSDVAALSGLAAVVESQFKK